VQCSSDTMCNSKPICFYNCCDAPLAPKPHSTEQHPQVSLHIRLGGNAPRRRLLLMGRQRRLVLCSFRRTTTITTAFTWCCCGIINDELGQPRQISGGFLLAAGLSSKSKFAPAIWSDRFEPIVGWTFCPKQQPAKLLLINQWRVFARARDSRLQRAAVGLLFC